MLPLLLEYAPLISAGLTGVTAAIWIVYLNVFLMSYRRQHCPSILITSGAGRGLNSHCFVTNLGLEPVFLLDIVLDARTTDGDRLHAVIPERNERHSDKEEPDTDARGATNLGPLASGEEKDIGRFTTLIQRARAENPDWAEDLTFRSLKITVVAVTASRAELYGAEREYVLAEDRHSQPCLRPTTIKARQIDSFFGRRALGRVLREDLGLMDNP